MPLVAVPLIAVPLVADEVIKRVSKPFADCPPVFAAVRVTALTPDVDGVPVIVHVPPLLFKSVGKPDAV